MYLSLETIQKAIFFQEENLKRMQTELAIRIITQQPRERLQAEIDTVQKIIALWKEMEQQRQGV